MTKNKKLGDASNFNLKCLKDIFKKVDDSRNDVHIIFLVLKNNPSIENMLPVFKFFGQRKEKKE